MSLFAYTNDLGMDAYEMSEQIGFDIGNVWKTALLAFALLAIAVSFIYSLIRTVISYYQFRIYRTPDGYRILSGLLNRKQLTARDKKMQIIEWSDNPLKRIAGIFDMYLKQASSIAVNDKEAVIIPGCNKSVIERIKKNYFNGNEWESLINVDFSDKIVIYKLIYKGLLPSIVISVMVFVFGTPIMLLPVLFWMVIVFIASKVMFIKRKCSLNEHILYIQKGLFANNNEVLRLNKIQSVSLRQNLYQKRNALSDVIIHTAAGKIVLPFLKLDDSRKMVNYFLYKVETDNNRWM
jgi:putative membrane protein